MVEQVCKRNQGPCITELCAQTAIEAKWAAQQAALDGTVPLQSTSQHIQPLPCCECTQSRQVCHCQPWLATDQTAAWATCLWTAFAGTSMHLILVRPSQELAHCYSAHLLASAAAVLCSAWHHKQSFEQDLACCIERSTHGAGVYYGGSPCIVLVAGPQACTAVEQQA